MKNTNHIRTTSLSHGDKLEARRLKAAKLFKKGLTQVEIARKLAVSRQAVNKWQQAWEKKGDKGLISKGKPGPQPKLQLIPTAPNLFYTLSVATTQTLPHL